MMKALAKEIWNREELYKQIYWEYPEGYDTDEWQAAWGRAEFDGWLFTLNDSSDYICFTAPNGEEGEFLNQ